MKGFVNFVREQGVVGFAVGFILGGSVSKLVTSLVNDIINPIIGILIGPAGSLKDNYLKIGSAKIMWGSFITTFIDFLVIALIVYFGVTIFRLDRLDRKKEIKKEKSQ